MPAQVDPDVSKILVSIKPDIAKPGSSNGELHVEKISQKERSKKAFKYFGACLVLGLFSVALPIAHFILVPSFLIAGPILAYLTYQKETQILGGSLTCPCCGKPIDSPKGALKLPLSAHCHACNTPLSITALSN